jgi:para-aminobenzoate synthetase/4-amino-4-deoxychorismate lyase
MQDIPVMASPPHPNPATGVFETILVVDGHPVELDAHLRRLSRSLRTLFGIRTPAGTRKVVLERAEPLRLGRLRLTARPSSGDLGFEIETASVAPALFNPAWESGASAVSLIVPGGLGEHKWADRSLLARADANAREGEVPLLVDLDGSMLEASRANVFALRDGALATPPADGRILPGIARSRVIGLAREAGIEVREKRLAIAQLAPAEVFLTSSVRGVEPIRQIDGVECRRPGEIVSSLAAALRGLWLEEKRRPLKESG